MCLIERVSYLDAEGKLVHSEVTTECKHLLAGRDCPQANYRDAGEQPLPHRTSQASTAAQNSPTYSAFSSDRSAVGTAVSSRSTSSSTVTPGLSRHYSQKERGAKPDRRRSSVTGEIVGIVNNSSPRAERRRNSHGHSRESSSSAGVNEPTRPRPRVPAPEPPSPADSFYRRRFSLGTPLQGSSPAAQRPSSSSAALGPTPSFSGQRGANLEERRPRPYPALIVADARLHVGPEDSTTPEDLQKEPSRPSRQYSSEPTSSRHSNRAPASPRAADSRSRRGSTRFDSSTQRPVLHQQLRPNPTSPSSVSFRPAPFISDSRQTPPPSQDSSPASASSTSGSPPPAQRPSGGQKTSPGNDYIARVSIREEQRKRNAQDSRLIDLEQQVSNDTEKLASVANEIQKQNLSEQRQREAFQSGETTSSARNLFRSSGSKASHEAAQKARKKELSETRGRIKSLEQKSKRIFARKIAAQTQIRLLREDIAERGVEPVTEEAESDDGELILARNETLPGQLETVYEVRSPAGTLRRSTELLGMPQTFETKIVRDRAATASSDKDSRREGKMKGKRRAAPAPLTLSNE